ncbi:helix-turn-helix domain-containing protein [Aquimarina sp. 2201CG14-23]|uniref:helix-turn-helix domain-containing protein n=1 Tax=Aquimarina mycalae TaxID=3040073 RepID=UPI00247827F5|nr:helix-turn-helix transcriptional regulator [Aquimarina sp. 2201CG14-23]MDH7448452.1 helix-turn-helix transcriptional regulator [Aquimarina sp. 2201CG14-23]
MNKQTHLLKDIRTGAEVMQQDVAFLLNIDTGSLARYENEKRIPTPEILLMYHILFGVPISELLSPLLKRVKKNLISRSTLLHTQAKAKHTPKSIHSSSYIEAVVNNLSQTKMYDA